jgi:hypothetical protein
MSIMVMGFAMLNIEKNEPTPKEQQETEKQIVENLGGGSVAQRPSGRSGDVSAGFGTMSDDGGSVLGGIQRDLRTAAIESSTTPEVNHVITIPT